MTQLVNKNGWADQNGHTTLTINEEMNKEKGNNMTQFNTQFNTQNDSAKYLKLYNSDIKAIHGPYLDEDYSKFIIHPLNRTPEVEDIKRLKKTIEEKNLHEPIKVNEMMEIMDGNHRFEVWKDLSMPVLYMVYEGMRMEHVPIINDNQKKWNWKTYLNYYGAVEKDNNPDHYSLMPYNLFKKFSQQHPFSNNILMLLLCERSLDRSSSKTFKEGKMIINDWSKAKKRATFLESMKNLIPDIWEKRSFIIAMLHAVKHSEFNEKRWTDQLERNRSEIWICSNNKQYLERIEYIYNKKRAKKIYFTREGQ
tara:strand:+ start:263 stop:1186 length:924 start_codon:yes stop_codon:yes gene_type:complete